MKNIYLALLIGTFILTSCKDQKTSESVNTQDVVDKAINVIGGEQFKSSEIEFDFRDKHYIAIRDKWKFQYERIWNDSLGTIKDVLSNSGFEQPFCKNPFSIQKLRVWFDKNTLVFRTSKYFFTFFQHFLCCV